MLKEFKKTRIPLPKQTEDVIRDKKKYSRKRKYKETIEDWLEEDININIYYI